MWDWRSKQSKEIGYLEEWAHFPVTLEKLINLIIKKTIKVITPPKLLKILNK